MNETVAGPCPGSVSALSPCVPAAWDRGFPGRIVLDKAPAHFVTLEVDSAFEVNPRVGQKMMASSSRPEGYGTDYALAGYLRLFLKPIQ